MRNATDILQEILFVVGKTESTIDARLDPWQILNRAGRALYTRYPWSWRGQGPIEIRAVADQDYIELPVDFAAPLKVVNTAGNYTVETVSADRIMELRQNGSAYAGGTCYVSFVPWDGQKTGEGLPMPRMDLYPTPTTNDEPTLSLRYTRRWKELFTGDPNAKPNIPNEAEQALVYKGQAIIKATVEEDPGVFESLFESEVQRLIAVEESGRQINYGRSRGGADDLPPSGGSYAPPIDSVTWS